MKTRKCPACEGLVSKSARRCPHCGHYNWTTGRIVLMLIFIPIIGVMAWASGTCMRFMAP